MLITVASPAEAIVDAKRGRQAKPALFADDVLLSFVDGLTRVVTLGDESCSRVLRSLRAGAKAHDMRCTVVLLTADGAVTNVETVAVSVKFCYRVKAVKAG